MVQRLNTTELPPKFPKNRDKDQIEGIGALGGLGLGAVLSTVLGIAHYDGEFDQRDALLEKHRADQVEYLAAAEKGEPVNGKAKAQIESLLDVVEPILLESNPDIDPKDLTSLREATTKYYNSGELSDLEQLITKVDHTEINPGMEMFLGLIATIILVVIGIKIGEGASTDILKDISKSQEQLLGALKALAERDKQEIRLSEIEKVTKPFAASIRNLTGYNTGTVSEIEEHFRTILTKLLDMESTGLASAMVKLLGDDGTTAFGLRDEDYLQELILAEPNRKAKLQELGLTGERSTMLFQEENLVPADKP